MENTQKEIWKDCKGYEGFYQVSNLGRVKSLERVRSNHTGGIWIQPERILALRQRGDGYLAVNLRLPKGKPKQELVHRLVALAFLDNPENKKEVNHLNSIRNDNRVENLEWATRTENNQQAWTQNHKNKRKLLCITTGEVFMKAQDAADKNGGCSTAITKAARDYDTGKIHTVFGYSYCYIANENYYLNKKNNNLEVN